MRPPISIPSLPGSSVNARKDPERAKAKAQTFNQLRAKLDDLSNAPAEIEQFLSPSVAPLSHTSEVPLPYPMLYFCIPKNDKLLGYWDTVADRLFKIRHCMNIEGVVRQLPLFEPPIDPALLVRAAAAGVDISSVLNDLSATLPHYRFGYIVQKALEVCAEVKSLAAALLSTLEKRDAEQLSNLRAGHEVSLLKAVRHIKERQLEEAEESLLGLGKAYELTTIRHRYLREYPVHEPGRNGSSQPHAVSPSSTRNSGAGRLCWQHDVSDPEYQGRRSNLCRRYVWRGQPGPSDQGLQFLPGCHGIHAERVWFA